ncbi:MAG: aldehyde dehydrogenase family protein [Pseudomonadales bacterium]|nr:MAG: aldehyde dehydrogenase family protein [Pseudomonadales bacterium]
MHSSHCEEFYIDGRWTAPQSRTTGKVLNPFDESTVAEIALGSRADIDLAVAAARKAFPSYAQTSASDRRALLQRILEQIETRADDIASALSQEMGAPISLARGPQFGTGVTHIKTMIDVIENYSFSKVHGNSLIVKEPIGVCGLIAPWNWPIGLVLAKVVGAIAAGCTMVLKPSEICPLNSLIIAEVLHDAGVPPGVFNLVNGDGANTGAALAAHPDVDMVTFTGSTRAGIEIAKLAAPTVKRVHQELGGKSANLLLDDDGFAQAVADGVRRCFINSGQVCTAPSRMLVPADRMDEAAKIAGETANSMRVGNPADESVEIGPVANETQLGAIRRYIKIGEKEGARLVTGGADLPQGFNQGYFVQPTVFADVTPEMTIAREEIFGPVLSLIAYQDEDHAIEIANGTVYGLAAYVSSTDLERARNVAAQLRAGLVPINYAITDLSTPFGGYKQSGNGRENGVSGLEGFLETKTISGYGG